MTQQYKLNGLAASAGKGSGSAVIVIDSETFVLPKDSDRYVVVADLTTPDLTSLLIDAAGIVTDIGGLSSHAANIARELGIPCVVSTIYATKLINQGDLVEVDGDNGIVQVTSIAGCIYCTKHPKAWVLETEQFFALYDGYPVCEGHLLLIPKRHVQSIAELRPDEFQDLYHILHLAIELLRTKYDAEVYNLGINEGAAAGQTIAHLHIHVIPRKYGDVTEYKGGVRNFLANPLTVYTVGSTEGEPL